MPEEAKAKERILIVEDEENGRQGYEALLRKWGFDVLAATNAEEALARFSEFRPAALIADVELPGMDGLELLHRLGDELRDVPALIITGKGSDERAVAAIEAGAFWYIEKPLKAPVLRALLDRALGKARDRKQLTTLTRELRDSGRLGELVGASKPMQELMHLVELAAPSSASVLITGETGSGKEIAARSIHRLSPRAGQAFVAINCSAIPETLMESEIFGHEKGAFTGAAERRLGCFELADGGTLLLDEIGEMPAPTQAKLLRVLEDHKVRRLGSKTETPVDVRVVAATNKDPEQAVAKGQIRQDLYFRLNVIRIDIPPLRARRDDIPLLCAHFLRLYSARYNSSVRELPRELRNAFQRHDWPGNVRELENAVRRYVILPDLEMSLANLEETQPAPDRPELSLVEKPNGDRPLVRRGAEVSLRKVAAQAAEEAERKLLRRVLAETRWNRREAASQLKISYKALLNKLKKWEAEEQAAAAAAN